MRTDKDIQGECNARLYLGDDEGDGTCTIRCGLPEGHEGQHEEAFTRSFPTGGPLSATIRWNHDERRPGRVYWTGGRNVLFQVVCRACGKGPLAATDEDLFQCDACGAKGDYEDAWLS